MPWAKGESGNPNGRPKKNKTLTDMLEKALNKKDVRKGYNTVTRREAILEILTQEALKGDLKAINMILDRIEGKPAQTRELDVTGSLQMPNIILTSEIEENVDQ